MAESKLASPIKLWLVVMYPVKYECVQYAKPLGSIVIVVANVLMLSSPDMILLYLHGHLFTLNAFYIRYHYICKVHALLYVQNFGSHIASYPGRR